MPCDDENARCNEQDEENGSTWHADDENENATDVHKGRDLVNDVDTMPKHLTVPLVENLTACLQDSEMCVCAREFEECFWNSKKKGMYLRPAVDPERRNRGRADDEQRKQKNLHFCQQQQK